MFRFYKLYYDNIFGYTFFAYLWLFSQDKCLQVKWMGKNADFELSTLTQHLEYAS